MSFLHCDRNEQYLTLHDCVAERAWFADGKLGFAFADGFWILPDHPENHLKQTVRTDASQVEFTLEDGLACDVTTFVFKRTYSGELSGRTWTLGELVDAINAGKCKLEFLYQFLGYKSRMVECELIFGDTPQNQDRHTCILRISAPEVRYDWNHLRADRVW